MEPRNFQKKFLDLHPLVVPHLVNKLFGVGLVDHGGNICILLEVCKQLGPVSESIQSPAFM